MQPLEPCGAARVAHLVRVRVRVRVRLRVRLRVSRALLTKLAVNSGSPSGLQEGGGRSRLSLGRTGTRVLKLSPGC